MARLYHPDLGVGYECPDDEGLLSVLAACGWLPAPVAEAQPGYEPEPVKYAPVEPEPAEPVKSKRSTKAES